MKKLFLFLALCALLGGCEIGEYKDAGTGINDAKTSKVYKKLPFDRYFFKLAEEDKFNGSVLVALADTVFEQSYRMPSAPTGMHTSSNKAYPAGELSHLFIRAAFFYLADQGRITLNGAVSEYLPELPEHEVINYRMLLDHRAGLPQQLMPGTPLASLQLRSKPGAEEHFSPLGYELLAQVLSERLGTNLAHALKILVFDPAGMKQTGQLLDNTGNLAIGYSDATGTLQQVPLTINNGATNPELYTCLTDLFYFAQWLPESAYLKGSLKQPAVRPGYRHYFEAAADGSLVKVILSNYGGADLTLLAKKL